MKALIKCVIGLIIASLMIMGTSGCTLIDKLRAKTPSETPQATGIFSLEDKPFGTIVSYMTPEEVTAVLGQPQEKVTEDYTNHLYEDFRVVYFKGAWSALRAVIVREPGVELVRGLETGDTPEDVKNAFDHTLAADSIPATLPNSQGGYYLYASEGMDAFYKGETDTYFYGVLWEYEDKDGTKKTDQIIYYYAQRIEGTTGVNEISLTILFDANNKVHHLEWGCQRTIIDDFSGSTEE